MLYLYLTIYEIYDNWPPSSFSVLLKVFSFLLKYNIRFQLLLYRSIRHVSVEYNFRYHIIILITSFYCLLAYVALAMGYSDVV